jgi:hypothetical protein
VLVEFEAVGANPGRDAALQCDLVLERDGDAGAGSALDDSRPTRDVDGLTKPTRSSRYAWRSPAGSGVNTFTLVAREFRGRTLFAGLMRYAVKLFGMPAILSVQIFASGKS